MRVILVLFIFLSNSAFAAKLGEDKSDVVSAHCKKRPVVSILKFASAILGTSEIYYDCASSELLLKTPRELSPVILSFSVDRNIVDLNLKLTNSRLVKVNLNKTVTVSINSAYSVEVISFSKKRNRVQRSLNNIPFLVSITNAPGWPDYDNL